MITNNINKVTSRKSEGAAENNRFEVRKLCSKALRYADGICVVTDRAGHKIFVDTKKGLTGIIREFNFNNKMQTTIHWYEDGSTSCKDNGYVYTPIVINGLKGYQQTLRYATHSLVAMLAHTSDYDALSDKDITPIANHKNNKSWDNRAENLEWTSPKGNARHGKIVASLNRWFNGIYTHTDYNEGDTEFIVLNEALSVKDIERYCEEIENTTEFKCDNNEYINEEVIKCFIDWLENKGIW